MILGTEGLRKSRAHCCKSVHIALTQPCRFEVLNGSGLLSRFRPGKAIVSGISADVSSGSALLASRSSSEITTECSSSCTVVFGRNVVDFFHLDFDADVSKVTEIPNFYFDAEATKVADADAQVFQLLWCDFFFFNFSFLRSC